MPVRERLRRLIGLSPMLPPLQKRLPKAHSLPSLSTRRNIGMARGSCESPASISMMISCPASYATRSPLRYASTTFLFSGAKTVTKRASAALTAWQRARVLSLLALSSTK